MEIRPATPDDRSAIIGLLRESLGESTIPKSEALWIWKHEQNPFGPSFVLVAEEDKQLIGLRAFMQWQWEWKGRVYNAIRAVDTATHPAHQGKGIFRRLTLEQAEICRRQGIHFIFNTPNEQSKPGYLKMGWVVQDTMPLKFTIVKPWKMFRAKYIRKERANANTEDPTPFQKWTHLVFNMAGRYVHQPQQLSTPLSPAFLSWRYGNNPLFRYNYFTDNEDYLLITRVKDHSFGKELRLVDFLLTRSGIEPKKLNTGINAAIKQFTRDNDIAFIAVSGQQYRRYRPFFRWMGRLPVLKQGPVITLRDLNMHDAFAALMPTRNWCYSLGDMELF